MLIHSVIGLFNLRWQMNISRNGVDGMKKMFGLALVVLMGLTTNSFAAMVTETWSAYITGFSSNVDTFTVGEQIQWSVTFNDEQHTSHKYWDSDGSVSQTLNWPPFNGTSGYNYASDATFDFNNIFTRLLGGDLINDSTDQHFGWATNYTFVSGEINHRQQYGLDSMSLFLQNGGGNFSLAGIDTGFRQISFDSASISPVPIPAAVWLFGTGLLGLLGLSYRKNKV